MAEFDLPYKAVGNAEYEVFSFYPPCPSTQYLTLPLYMTSSCYTMIYPLEIPKSIFKLKTQLSNPGCLNFFILMCRVWRINWARLRARLDSLYLLVIGISFLIHCLSLTVWAECFWTADSFLSLNWLSNLFPFSVSFSLLSSWCSAL